MISSMFRMQDGFGLCIKKPNMPAWTLHTYYHYYCYNTDLMLHFIRFLLYTFNTFQFILKVAGEVMNVVVRAKNAMRVKVIVIAMTNVCQD